MQINFILIHFFCCGIHFTSTWFRSILILCLSVCSIQKRLFCLNVDHPWAKSLDRISTLKSQHSKTWTFKNGLMMNCCEWQKKRSKTFVILFLCSEFESKSGNDNGQNMSWAIQFKWNSFYLLVTKLDLSNEIWKSRRDRWPNFLEAI